MFLKPEQGIPSAGSGHIIKIYNHWVDIIMMVLT